MKPIDAASPQLRNRQDRVGPYEVDCLHWLPHLEADSLGFEFLAAFALDGEATSESTQAASLGRERRSA